MTDLGSPNQPMELRGEQWRLELRTSDPPSPHPDERWIRTDLTDGDRLATLKTGDGSEIPILPTGSAQDTVREAYRVQVDDQIGYLPIAPPDDAAYPGRRIQHNGQVYALHSRAQPGSAIPDSVVYQWDSRNAFDSGQDGSSVTEWPTEVGGITATGGSPIVRNDGINGYRALEFDGVDDFFDVDFAAIPQPYTIFAVMQRRGSSNDAIYNAIDTAGQLYWSTNDEWVWSAGNFENTGAGTGNEQLMSVFADGADSELRGDGTTFSTSDAGSADFGGITIGSFTSSGTTHFEGEIGLLEIHNGVPSNGLQTREQEIADDWGVTL